MFTGLLIILVGVIVFAVSLIAAILCNLGWVIGIGLIVLFVSAVTGIDLWPKNGNGGNRNNR